MTSWTVRYLHFSRKGVQLTPPPTFFFLAALTALRNQLTIKFGEEPIQPDDQRLALARSWLEIAPGAQSVCSIWESTTEVRGRTLSLL